VNLKVSDLRSDGFVIVLFGTSLSALLGFLSNVLLARSIPIDTFGQLAFFYTCIVAVFSFCEMGFGTHYVVKVNQLSENWPGTRHKEMNWLYRHMIMVYGFPLGGVITGIAAYVYELSVLDYFGILIGALCLIHHKFLLSVCQSKENWMRFSLFQAIPILCRILAYIITIFGIAIFYQSLDMLISTKIALCSSLIVSIFLVTYWTPPNYLLVKIFNSSMRAFLLRGFFTQALINTAIVLLSRIDIFLLMYFVDSKGVALYFAANSVAMAIPLVTRSLMNYYMQKISSASDIEASSLLRNQFYLLPATIIVGGVLYLSSSNIMTLFFGLSYTDGGLVLGILSLGYLGGIVFTPLEAFFYSRNSSVVLQVKVASVLVMVTSSLLLVETYGPVGIAIGLLLAKLVGWLIVTFYYSKENPNEKRI
jgi:O-antigen/teichoic acid export membrane protein